MNWLLVVAVVLLILVPLMPRLVRLRIRVLRWLKWNWVADLLENNFRFWVLTFRIVAMLVAVVILYVGLV